MCTVCACSEFVKLFQQNLTHYWRKIRPSKILCYTVSCFFGNSHKCYPQKWNTLIRVIPCHVCNHGLGYFQCTDSVLPKPECSLSVVVPASCIISCESELPIIKGWHTRQDGLSIASVTFLSLAKQ